MTQDPYDRRDVPPYVALIRIAAVIGMSTTIAFGIFLLLAGTRYFLWGGICIVAAVPFFALMRFAEGSAGPHEDPPAA
jgi:hypothetical protein